jgi:hypothetical protein
VRVADPFTKSSTSAARKKKPSLRRRLRGQTPQAEPGQLGEKSN